MRAAEITVTGQGKGMQEALEETERLGLIGGLAPKEVLRLRLLAEELFGMARGIVGEEEARYRIEADGKRFELRLNVEMRMTQERKKQLLSVSSQGRNAASTGFMGKLKDAIATALLPKESGLSFLSGFSMGCMSMAGAGGPEAQAAFADAFYWSMNQYKQAVDETRADNSESKEAWDELEKSIVANIADEVTVLVRGSRAEITIQKAF
ncbi:MAG: hypothetical protein IJR89_02945 [Clostridia bacterium]|nr:hypothetical protein [Clostridia bacterium]